MNPINGGRVMGWFDFEEFASMTGFHPGLRQLQDNSEAKWTNTATDMSTGGIHGIRYKVEKDALGNPLLLLQHWVHWPGNKIPNDEQKRRRPQLLAFHTETRTDENGALQVRPTAVEWMGRTYTDPEDIMKAMHLLQETATEIQNNILKNTERDADAAFSRMQRRVRQTKRRDEIPNLYDIAQRCGFKVPFVLEGMYYNGEFNFSPAAGDTAAPSYPLPLLRAMLGVEADWTEANGKAFSKNFTMANPEGQGYEGVSYQCTPEPNESGFTLSCRVWDSNAQGQRNQTNLYTIRFVPDGAGMMKLASLEMLGSRADVTDHKGVARAIRAMKYVHLAVQRGEPPMLSDIIHEHDLKAYLRKPDAPKNGPADPRTMIQVFGANTDAVFSQKEKSIGSNGAIIIRDFMQGKEWVKLGIGVDWGVTFGDAKKDFYHTIAHNYGRFVRHPAAPNIKPYVDTILNLETHEHEDHLRGVARLAKFGFDLPPMVMNQHTHNVLKRMMDEEKVEARQSAAILKNCHIVSFDKYKVPANPADVQTTRYGNTIIEQGWEHIHSDAEGRDKYFPLLTVYSAEHPEAKTTIRVGPAGHSAHALMFQVDGVLYTGDYKLDQTVPEKQRSDLDWIARSRDTAAVHVQESTNAARETTANVTVAQVKENRKQILRGSSEGRVLADMIGSNAVDVEMFCRALGEVRKETLGDKQIRNADGPYKYILFAGTAVRNKYSDLNGTEDFKAKMLKEYGIKTLHVSSKKARELLEGPEGESYAVIMTGTQDEALSITHRVSRDLHDTIRLVPGDTVMRLQAPIPGDGRAEMRHAQNNRYRHDFGCRVYDAVEMAAKGMPIYTSSHASRDDYKIVHEATGDLQKLVHHGGPAQLQAMQKVMADMGARSIIPDKQVLYRVDKATRSAVIAGETPEERVGFREIRADADEFYDKQRQQPTVFRVKDRWTGDVAARMYRFEQLVARREDRLRTHAPTSRGSNIAGQFNEASQNADFPTIGILHPAIARPYHANHKNIKLFIGMDTETTGKNAATDVHTDISFVATDPQTGEVVRRKTMKYAVPRYMLAGPGALAVTGNDQPESVHKGLPLRKYAWKMLEVFRDWPAQITKDDHARAVFFGYRNGVFDDPITMRMLGMALASDSMKPMATHGNMQLDVFNLYTAMLAIAPEKVVGVKDKDGNYVRNLGTVCEANGIEVDKTKTHGSAYDAELTASLLHKLRVADPDVFEQMLMNCDFSSSRRSPMIDHILGQNLHVNDQAPVFGYVDRRDRTCAPKIGGLVTIDTKVSRATDAIVIDLAKADPHQLEQLSDEELLAAMNDREGPFAVIKLNNSPCLFPPQFVFRDGKVRNRAVGKLPKTTLLQRANALKQMRSSTQDVGNNFIQRVQRLYPQSRLTFNPEVTHEGMHRPANDSSFRLPAERVFSIFHVIKGINQTKSRHYKAAAGLLRDIKITAAEFEKDFDEEAFWTSAVKRARDLSVESGSRDPYIEDIRLLVEWMADDINPKYLPEADRARINALKSAMLHGPDTAPNNTVERFRREVAEMDADEARRTQVFGAGDEGAKKWEEAKATYLQYADLMDQSRKYAMTEEKREALRQFRRNSNQAGPRMPRMG
jgi:mRNA degradation ribonuclease J1/J2/exonuclease I